jgi:uncharacterized membrane protein
MKKKKIFRIGKILLLIEVIIIIINIIVISGITASLGSESSQTLTPFNIIITSWLFYIGLLIFTPLGIILMVFGYEKKDNTKSNENE